MSCLKDSKKYKEERGSCLVPYRYQEDPQLNKWMASQRRISTVDDKMKQERHDKLNSIGFCMECLGAI
jgi:hypothetical protein